MYLQDPVFLHQLGNASSGLGIQDADQKTDFSTQIDQPIQAEVQPPRRRLDDELYFDEGLADELDFEHDGTIFDESIFDINDTDRYGRPIPGAFAQAKEAMQAAQQPTSKRDSDMTSQSAISQSTAHTSLSVGIHQPTVTAEKIDDLISPRHIPPAAVQEVTVPGLDLAYQAALAEAAQKAAASGKFRRTSSPPPLTELTITSPTDSSESPQKPSDADYSLETYEDEDPLANDLDDFDFDDEAIIAEANASALANDSDGFYGQEFGFYLAPLSQTPYAHSHQSSSSSTGADALSAENLYQYANGGFFGPGGLARTTSRRVVPREPNLTPITERSEYSNCNSVMSLALPPVIGSDGRSSAAGMQSPGLAQLAMLSSEDDKMNLSALLKLRSRRGEDHRSAWAAPAMAARARREEPALPVTRAAYLGMLNLGLARPLRTDMAIRARTRLFPFGAARTSVKAAPAVLRLPWRRFLCHYPRLNRQSRHFYLHYSPTRTPLRVKCRLFLRAMRA